MKNSQNKNLYEELTSNTRWYLQDEEGKYVHQDSIRKISDSEYTYTAYERPERYYTSEESAELALYRLELHNSKGNLRHSFTIKSEPKQEPTSYVIKDQDNRFVDGNSLFIIYNDDTKTSEWQLLSFSTEINSIFRYNSRDYAEQVMAKLNALKQLAGFTDVEFHVEEFAREGYTPAEMTVQSIPVPRGRVTLHKKLLKKIRMQYMN